MLDQYLYAWHFSESIRESERKRRRKFNIRPPAYISAASRVLVFRDSKSPLRGPRRGCSGLARVIFPQGRWDRVLTRVNPSWQEPHTDVSRDVAAAVALVQVIDRLCADMTETDDADEFVLCRRFLPGIRGD